MPNRPMNKLHVRIMDAIRKDPGEVYAVVLWKRFHDEDGRSYQISSLHTALHELEDAGKLVADWAPATPERGNRRRRLYRINPLKGEDHG